MYKHKINKHFVLQVTASFKNKMTKKLYVLEYDNVLMKHPTKYFQLKYMLFDRVQKYVSVPQIWLVKDEVPQIYVRAKCA